MTDIIVLFYNAMFQLYYARL